MQGLMQRIGTTCDATKKGTPLALHLKKKLSQDIFLNLVPKAIKLIVVHLKSQMQFGLRIDLVDDYCLDKGLAIFKYLMIHFIVKS